MSRRPFLATLLAFGSLALGACGDDLTQPTAALDPNPNPQPTVASGSWITRADYLIEMWQATSAAITNASTLRTIVYVIGGHPRPVAGGNGAISSAVKAYDVSANVWHPRAPYPVRVRSTNGAVVIDGKIYVSGGFTRLWDEQRGVWRLEALRSLYVYDPATDQWTRRRDMPIATVNGVSGTYGGMLYVASSCYDQVPCGEQYNRGALWRYNPATDRWVMLGRTPHDPWSAGGGFIGGKLYLLENLGAMDVYDPATSSWTTGPQRPGYYCAPAYTTSEAKLYLVGCAQEDDYSGRYPMLVFDPKVGSWAQAAAPPADADDWWTLSRVFVNGQPRLELMGGSGPGNNLQYVP